MRTLLVVALAVLAPLSAVAATGDVNVSNARGSQAEVAVAVDPAQPNVVFAASNSLDTKALGNLMRTYTSLDGGATWTGAPGPAATPFGGRKRCNGGDPAPAVDAAGRQYLAFLAIACPTKAGVIEDDREFDIARLEVAARSGPTAAWRVAQVFPVRSARLDDKPALAIDRRTGRLYVAWTRVKPGARRGSVTLLVVVSRSDDGGATWSKPVVVPDEENDQTFFAALAVDSAGTVYVAWSTSGRNIFVDRSTDGGQHFGTDVAVARRETLPYGACQRAGSFAVPAQSRRCITSAPLVLVDSRADAPERVYVTYSAAEPSGLAQDVYVRPFDAALTALGPPRLVHPADVNRDEFLPASAVDEAGRIWVCFYDTGVDTTRRSVRYSCTASADGAATWAAVRPVSSVASNEERSPAIDFQFGDYEGLAVAGGIAHPVWTDARDLRARGEEIYASTLTAADLQLP